MKKLTYSYVKSKFEERGYTLLSNEYINSKTKLDYVCPEGHEGSIIWNAWERGQRCPYCAGRPIITIDIVRKSFEKEGYVLLSNIYLNNRTKLKYRCFKGHEHGIKWNDWQQGYRCPYCAGRPIITIEQVSASFETEGYGLLSTEYINNRQKLMYICPNNHEGTISYDSWSRGCRCSVCANNIKLSIDFVRDSFESEGYKLLSTTYINKSTKLMYICPNGHEHSATWDSWQQGKRCPTCYKLNNFGENNPSWRGGKSFEEYCQIWKDQEFKQDIRERDGNVCLNPYCTSKNPNDLTIHHINYNKKDCHPKNLITVCRSCNARANYDRRWHKAWYQAILNKRYKYNY